MLTQLALTEQSRCTKTDWNSQKFSRSMVLNSDFKLGLCGWFLKNFW